MSRKISYDTCYLKGAVEKGDLEAVMPELRNANSLITGGRGKGSDFLGWVDLPEKTGEDLVSDMENTAAGLREISDVIVVAGIGGSYLGAKAAINALYEKKPGAKVVFAGYNLSGFEMNSLLSYLKDKDVSVNVISKSGTTTETAVTFRIFEAFLRDKYGKDGVKDRVVCTTDGQKGALREIARKRGYKSFVIPPDVGGRFSVLSPVGLFPIACAGLDIRAMLEGSRSQKRESMACDLDVNISYKYAAVRNILYRKGKRIEILSSFDSRMYFINEWWKQLFGESEGKNLQGLFPASCEYTTDLHSMGQLIQQGQRNIFETFLVVEKKKGGIEIPADEDDLDGLNYLAGKQVDLVNAKAFEATAEAHFEGGVPNSAIKIPELSAFSLGQLFYFFEMAVAASAYMFGVNPFDQPGVEAYKNKMFKLLGKPGA